MYVGGGGGWGGGRVVHYREIPLYTACLGRKSNVMCKTVGCTEIEKEKYQLERFIP